MKTVAFCSCFGGVLGERAVINDFSKIFLRDREVNGVDWDFVWDESAHATATYFVMLISPTARGVAWAQRRKNDWVLGGVPVSRLGVVALFASCANALPLKLIERTLSLPVAGCDTALDELIGIDNDPLSSRAAPSRRFQQTVVELRARWERESNTSEKSGVSWSEIEKEVLSVLWETWRTDTPVEQRVRAQIAAVLERRAMTSTAATLLEQLERRVIDHVAGLGPLEPLLRDPDINEIMIVGTRRMFVEKRGTIEELPSVFENETHLKTLIERIVAPSGRRVDWAAPFCDVRLRDGSRVNVVLPPLALDGPCVTVRRFRPGFSSMHDLENAGTVTDRHAEILGRAVKDRHNILIAGNTGAGKTTLLNVLAAFIPDNERILTLEDAAELSLAKPHVVRLETRLANSEGKGAVSMRDLVVNALRMRPDRLLVGECRGDEVLPMLQAMNTGHDGSMTTLHANSADEVMPRLESMVSMAAPGWSLDTIRQQIRSAFDTIVYMRRDGALRRVVEVRDVV